MESLRTSVEIDTKPLGARWWLWWRGSLSRIQFIACSYPPPHHLAPKDLVIPRFFHEKNLGLQLIIGTNRTSS
jgi:hypothetical protein